MTSSLRPEELVARGALRLRTLASRGKVIVMRIVMREGSTTLLRSVEREEFGLPRALTPADRRLPSYFTLRACPRLRMPWGALSPALSQRLWLRHLSKYLLAA